MTADPETLLDALPERMTPPPDVTRHLTDALISRPPQSDADGLLPTLTARELEVIRLLAAGVSTHDVADRLYISQRTVSNHLRNVLEKLALQRRMTDVIATVRAQLPRAAADAYERLGIEAAAAKFMAQPSAETDDAEAPTSHHDEAPAQIVVGDTVRVTAGAFAQFKGTVVDHDATALTLTVEVNIFGRPTPVNLQIDEVEQA